MIGVIIIDRSSDILFEHQTQNLFRNKKTSGNNYLMQLLAPLLLSRKVLKSEETNLEITSFRFGKSRMAFADRFGITVASVGKSCTESEMNSFMENVLMLVEILFGPDIAAIRVSPVLKEPFIITMLI